MQQIKFKENYNGKLHCKYFTTYREIDVEKFKIHEIYKIICNDVFAFRAELINFTIIDVEKISDTEAFLDCGFNAEWLKEYLKNLYKGKKVLKILFRNIEY